MSSSDNIPARLEKEELDEQAQGIAKALGAALDSDVHFAVFLFKANGAMKFITDAKELADVDVIVDRWKEKVFGGAVAGESASAEMRRLRMYLVNAEITSCSDRPADVVDAAIARIREIKDRYRQDVPPGRRIL